MGGGMNSMHILPLFTSGASALIFAMAAFVIAMGDTVIEFNGTDLKPVVSLMFLVLCGLNLMIAFGTLG